MIRRTASGYRAKRAGLSARSLLLLLLVTGLTIGGPASAHEKHQHTDQKQSPAPSSLTPSQMEACTFTDSPLVSSHGEQIRFYSDLIKDKTVVISFVYTSCEVLCPLSALNMQNLQELLGERMGSDVYLVSVSIDPVVDTPTRLRAWSEAFKPGPYWTFVTGEKWAVDELLEALGVPVVNKEDHTLRMIVADGRNQVCTTSDDSPKHLRDVIDQIARGA